VAGRARQLRDATHEGAADAEDMNVHSMNPDRMIRRRPWRPAGIELIGGIVPPYRNTQPRPRLYHGAPRDEYPRPLSPC
jgi:hypothetical protein